MGQPLDIAGRIERLRAALRKAKLPAVLATSPESRRYFSGFEATDPMLSESSGALLVTLKGLWLLTDSRYVESAQSEAPLYEVIDTSNWGEAVKKLAWRLTAVAFEDESLSVAQLRRLSAAMPSANLVPCPFSLEAMRASKEPGEIDLIAKALRITEKAVGELFEIVKPGWTEENAARYIDRRFQELGGQGPAFETIVAAGPRASLPHAAPGPFKIKGDQMVVVDCGARYQGYCSDMTRTWAGDNLKPWQIEIYEIVRQAQAKAIRRLAPGRTGAEIDRAAREVIEAAGYGKFFRHSLGHGVGLAIHEEPRLSFRNKQPLPLGAVVTIEPGIYIPGQGGVRLEQLVHLSEDGPKVLNRAKNLKLPG